MKPAAAFRSTATARGAAALVVVMVLFFIMSLVAAYASRNLIFEQRTSANNYRSTQALEAAEAGLEWAVAMLNSGRIDANCAPTDDGVSTTFRERYLVPLANGKIGVRPWAADTATAPLLIRAGCVRGASGWVCSCPDAAGPTLTAPGGTGPAPAFRVAFVPSAQPGVVEIWSRGCTSLGKECDASVSARADANADVNALVALAPALAQAPAASLVVRGNLAPGSTSFVADFIASAPEAVAVNSGVPPPDLTPNLVLPAGSPPSAIYNRLVVPSNPTRWDITATSELTAGERFFLMTFGVAPDALRVQPAVHRLTCGADCGDALLNAVRDFPGRILWVEDDLNIGAGPTRTLGSAGAPVIVVVKGKLNFAAGSDTTINGLVCTRGAQLDATGATVRFQGALVAEGADDAGNPDDGKLTILGAPELRYDPDFVGRAREVVARTVLDFGSFARVPGSWRDSGL